MAGASAAPATTPCAPTSSSPATTPSSARRTRGCGARTSPACGCYRLSLAKVKWHSLTGEPLTGKEAAAVELINESVPFENLEARVNEIAAQARQDPAVPTAGAEAHRQPGLREHGPRVHPDTWRSILDGLMRNTPDALSFIETAGSQGVRAAVEQRDGPWGDYSQAPPERRPDPSHIIEP